MRHRETLESVSQAETTPPRLLHFATRVAFCYTLRACRGARAGRQGSPV